MGFPQLVPIVIGLITIIGLVSITISFFEKDNSEYIIVRDRYLKSQEELNDNNDDDMEVILSDPIDISINDFYTEEL